MNLLRALHFPKYFSSILSFNFQNHDKRGKIIIIKHIFTHEESKAQGDEQLFSKPHG